MIKKITFIALLFLCINFYGQHKRHEKLTEARVSFLTSRLSLTAEQAEKFWPIYNDAKKESFANKIKLQKIFKSIDYESITEEEAKETLKDLETLELSSTLIKKKLNADLKVILSTKQILILKNSEVLFKRKLLERIKGQH